MMKAFWLKAVRRFSLFELYCFLILLVTSSALIDVGVAQRGTQRINIFTLVLAIICFVMTCVLLVLESLHALYQKKEYDFLVVICVPFLTNFSYFKDYWNWLDWFCYVTNLYMSIRYIVDITYVWNSTERQVYAVATLYLWFKFLEYASLFEFTSGIARLFLGMLKTILQYLFLVFIFVLAFGHSFFLILVGTNDDYSTLVRS